jgi:modulator of FtsH protease HflC
VIPEWRQAIVTRFGQPIRTVREPGLYFKLPMVHVLTRFDKRILATDAPSGED